MFGSVIQISLYVVFKSHLEYCNVGSKSSEKRSYISLFDFVQKFDETDLVLFVVNVESFSD